MVQEFMKYQSCKCSIPSWITKAWKFIFNTIQTLYGSRKVIAWL